MNTLYKCYEHLTDGLKHLECPNCALESYSDSKKVSLNSALANQIGFWDHADDICDEEF